MNQMVMRNPHTQLPQDALCLSHEPYGLIITTRDEALIEDGKVFMAQAEVTVTTGATVYVLGITSTREIHMMGAGLSVSVPSGGIDVDIELVEGVTSTTVTGNVTPYNAERNSANVSTFLIHSSPATVTGGTILPMSAYVKTANQVYSVNISLESSYEMKLSTKYARKITNNGGQTATVLMQWRWYEVED